MVDRIILSTFLLQIPITHHIWRCTTISDLMINGQIRDKEVRVIGEDGEQKGVMPIKEAMRLAQEAELDLVKIAPTAKPPVCKIIDYGKYKYELVRKEKEEKGQEDHSQSCWATFHDGRGSRGCCTSTQGTKADG